MSQTKQDQAPPAPDGCVYGPWWGDVWECWWCIQLINGIERELTFEDGQWGLSDLDLDVTRELLRLAKQNAELRAENESLKTQACAFSLDATSAIVARCKREGKLTKFIKKTIELYGQPGGPWNITSDPGGWLNEARVLLGEPTVSHEETMKEIEE